MAQFVTANGTEILIALLNNLENMQAVTIAIDCIYSLYSEAQQHSQNGRHDQSEHPHHHGSHLHGSYHHGSHQGAQHNSSSKARGGSLAGAFAVATVGFTESDLSLMFM